MTSAPPKDTTYLDQRLAELAITPALNTFTRVWYQDMDETIDGQTITRRIENTRDYNLFDADEEGNILIRYFNLDGQPYRYKKEDTKQSRDYVRKRIRDPKSDFKYHQEKGSPQFPYFNPSIIAKYQANRDAINIDNSAVAPIDTLFVVEGEFKSFKGYMAGLDIIGLPSIHGFYNGDVKGKLHEDIQELIIMCQVKKIVFLVDADLLTLNWAADKDLHKRPASFYGSIKAFRESIQLLLDDDKVALELAYFMHIQTKYVHEAKGLDDLLCKFSAVENEILADLRELNFAKKYFNGMSILDQGKDVHTRVYAYLGLVSEQEFYKTYADYIGIREFKFKRRRYIYDAEKREVVYVRHEDADKFMRIGPDWVKVITKFNKYGEIEEEMVSWKVSEIQRDYAKKFPGFIDDIVRYDDLCNEPSWNGSYQQSVNNCFNVCRPLKWQPQPGSIEHTVGFLKHVFGGNGNIILDDQGHYEREEAALGDQFTVAMDWLSILFRYPKQMLPVPCLVSPENGTGKSTFLKWLQMLFGDNMCILGNAQFQMKFNMHYATKFVISIDEGFLEVDKKAEKERLKQLVTADSIYVEGKGMNARKIAYYGKLIICSNDADRVMKIEEGESRWFVVRVPVIPKEKKDPDLELKMKVEAEAFLHYIMTRQIVHPREDRLWFQPDYFITEQFRIIVETTKNRIDRVFESWLRDQFMMFKLPVLRYTTAYLVKVFNDPKNSKYKMDELDLKNYLAGRDMHAAKESIYFKTPMGFKETTYHSDENEPVSKQPVIVWWGGTGRPYEFRSEEWLSAEDCATIGSILPAVEGQSQTPNSDDLPF